ncbi:M23 family metallopeptidase [Penaeicola halotolerans]|uniref:M23 family metallopeptidase n=1 Tax=Penaeicola halotolerans TaxID=2793196 RepID=UPI001CF8C974|nr:M23 family metallopeptidase [Penaeicola halotolerans]
MPRIKYYYDSKTCKYERITRTKWEITMRLLGFLSLSLVFAIGMLILFNTYFDSPKELMLKKENAELKYYYELMDKELSNMAEMTALLQERDDNLYRVLFGTEPIPSTIRNAGFGGSDRYQKLREEGLKQEKLILNTIQKVDILKKKLYIQSVSYDDLAEMATNKDVYWASIPAIQPINNQELKRLASGYGIRLHPIYKVRRMHTGVDFSAPKGTPIYATGDGVVTKVVTLLNGYGKYVEIDHGFGLMTRYAHMNEFNVKKGQKVKRGECIGYVGNTGSSTAPHVHYEVWKDGKHVNPVNYFFRDLQPDEFEKILELASKENQSLS